MIPSIHAHGTDAGGLITYLFAVPGRAENHANPRVVAAWLPSTDLAAMTAQGRTEPGALAAQLDLPVTAHPSPPAKPVWHCSVRLHPTDPVLDDALWGRIAGVMADAAGIAPAGDVGAARWIAVRHADDHIHIAATLVRADGRLAHTSHDYARVQTAARALEDELGLYRLGARDRTANRATHRNEGAKARRAGHAAPARDRLRRAVRHALAGATDPDHFLDRVTGADLLLRLRRTGPEVDGYAVALPEVTNAAGEAVYYSGGKLATDLTWPRIRQHLADTGPVNPDLEAAVADALIWTAAATHTGQIDDDLAHAAADLTTIAAAHAHPSLAAEFATATDVLDHAVRSPHGPRGSRNPAAQVVHDAARAFAAAPNIGDAGWRLAVAVARDVAALAEHLAANRTRQDRPAQARSAALAHHLLNQIAHTPQEGPSTPPGRTSPRRRTSPTRTKPENQHGRTAR